MIDRLRSSFRLGFIGLLLAGLLVPSTGCISSPSLTSITVTPTTMNYGGAGLSTHLTATGSYTHPNHPAVLKDITNDVIWTSAAPECVAVISSDTTPQCKLNNNCGVITSQNENCANIPVTAQMQGFPGMISGSMTVNVTGAVAPPEPITAVTIIPATLSVASAGQTGQFVALGTVGGTGLQVDLTSQVAWTSSSSSVAGIGSNPGANLGTKTCPTLPTNPGGTPGLATAVAAGTTNITAIWTNPDCSAIPASATFTVTGAAAGPLLSLAIIPNTQTMSAGQTGQLFAIGTFSTSPTTRDLTNANASTGSVKWSSSNTSVATVSQDASGVHVLAKSQGTAAITAIASNFNGTGSAVTATATLTVSTSGTVEPYTSVAIVPVSQTANAAGQRIQYIAIGTTSSGTTVDLTDSTANSTTTWSSSNEAVATFTPTPPPAVPLLQGQALTVANGATAISVKVTNPGVGGNAPDGSVVTATAVLTVNIPAKVEPIASLSIVPSTQSLQAGQIGEFVAIGTTSTGSSVDLTSQAAWSSSGLQIATFVQPAGFVAPAGAPSPLPANTVYAISPGTVAITAIVSNGDGTVVTGNAALTVTNTPEPLVSMSVSPSSQTFNAIDQQANLQALATTATGSTVNLTDPNSQVSAAAILKYGVAQWSSSDNSVASVTNFDKAKPNVLPGTVTVTGAGVAVITASATNPDGTVVSGTSTITSTASGASGGAITSITVLPGAQAVASPGDTAQFFAIGTTTTGATVDLTNDIADLTWNSSSANIASFTPVAPLISCPPAGCVTAVGPGTATITALYAPKGGNVVTGTATFTVSGGTTEEFIAPLTIVPGAQTVASGGTAQFIALATEGSSGNVVDVTNSYQLKWISSNESIATISTCPVAFAPTCPAAIYGVISGVSAGTSNITAELANFDASGNVASVVTSTATVTVTSAAPPENILTLSIYPNSITVLDFNLTGQFLAVGTYSQPPYVRDVTNSPSTTWLSSQPEIFPVGTNSGGNAGASAGLVTAIGSGGADIIAESASADGTIQIAQATFNCPHQLPFGTTPASCPAGGTGETLLETLTVYNEGLNTTNWEVTAPSATGTPDVVHCGPGWSLYGGTGGSVCTATYPETVLDNTQVILTAPVAPATPAVPATKTTPAIPATPGAVFGGWSYNCVPSDVTGKPLAGPIYWTANGPNYCVVTLSGNDSVGAIFNSPQWNLTVGILNNVAGADTVEAGSSPGLTIDCTNNAVGSTTSGTCENGFASGTSVTLTAIPTAPATTVTWSSNCTVLTATSCSVSMLKDQTVTATFN